MVSFVPQPYVRADHMDSRQPGMDEALPWPSTVWRTETTDQNRGAMQGVLVSAGAPVFPSFDLAARAFFHAPTRGNRNFDGRGIVIRKQDLRARIERVRIRTAEPVVTVGGHDREGKLLSLSGPDGVSHRLDADTADWSLPLPDGLPEAAWLALHDDQQLLDGRALDPNWGLLGDVEFEIEPGIRMEGLISRGEGSTLEFKRELPEDLRKVMKTVAAFSNGLGGTILFGVDDEQQVVGLSEGPIRETMDHLARFISDHVHPHPLFEIEPVTVGEHEIIALYVLEGPDTPYGVGQSDRKLTYYVRRGGNSSPARPEDIRGSVRARMPTDNGQDRFR